MNQLKHKLTYYFLPLCSVICVIMTGFNSFNWNDDFNYFGLLSKNGFLGEVYNQYFYWDGRAITPLFTIRNILLYYFPPQVLAVLALITIFITSYLICKILEKLEIIEIKHLYLVSIVGGILLWVSYRAHLGRSVYWATGSFYQVFNLFVFLWIYLYLKSKVSLPIFLLITFSMISSGVNIAMVIITLMFFFHILKYRIINFKKDFPVLTTIVLAFILCTFAPGNFVRAKTGYTTGIGYDTNISHFIYNYFIVLKEYVLMSKLLFIVATLFGILIFITNYSMPLRTKTLSIAVVFLLGGLSSILPFILVPDAASKHTSIHFQTCLFIFILLSVFTALNSIEIKFPNWSFFTLSNLICLYFCYVAIIQYQMGRSVKAQIESRYDYLETKRNSRDTIFLKTINQPDSFFTNRIWDIKNPPDDSNRILQRNFQTGPILPMKK